MTEYEMQFPDYKKYLELQISISVGCVREEERIGHHKNYLKYFLTKCQTDKSESILDVGCNIGLSLGVFKEMGFNNLQGVEVSPKTSKICRDRGFRVHETDAHFMDFVPPSSIDIVFATHSLEHMYSPSKVVQHIYNILKPRGYLFVVLPYPCGDSTGHLGGLELGICQKPSTARALPYDDGVSVIAFFKNLGFKLLDKKYDSIREPEIWLTMQKGISS